MDECPDGLCARTESRTSGKLQRLGGRFDDNVTTFSFRDPPGGNFLASVRHNVTRNGKTAVVIASRPGAPYGVSQFEHTVQSVEIVD